MTDLEKAEAALAAFQNLIECPGCHEYGERATIEGTGRCDDCYQRRLKAMRRMDSEERKAQRDTWKASRHGHW